MILGYLYFFSVLPKIVPFHFDAPIFAGEATQVTCLVSQGDQPLEITWNFQGELLTSELGVSTTKIGRKGSTLFIDASHSGHRGNYTCIARNHAGIANFTSTLEIHGTYLLSYFQFFPGSYLSVLIPQYFLDKAFRCSATFLREILPLNLNGHLMAQPFLGCREYQLRSQKNQVLFKSIQLLLKIAVFTHAPFVMLLEL